MKKRAWYLTGILAIGLVFGLVLAGCGDTDEGGSGGSIPTDLIGEWYTSPTSDNPEVTFTKNSISINVYSGGEADYVISGKKIKAGAKGTPAAYLQTFCDSYTVENDVLTRTNPGIITTNPLYRH